VFVGIVGCGGKNRVFSGYFQKQNRVFLEDKFVLTDRELRKIKPTGKVFKKPDGRGMAVRVGKQGTLTFVYRYEIKGKEETYDFGNYPDMSLQEAREKHHELRLLVKKGISPAEQKRQTRKIAEGEHNPSVANFAEKEYIERYLKKNLVSADEVARTIRVNLLSQIGDMKMRDVELRHVTLALDKVVDRGAMTMANRTLTYAKQLFGYAVRRGVIKHNPLTELRKKEVGGEEQSRDRALSNDELKALLLNVQRLEAPYAQWVLLLLMLGQRQGEVRLAKKADLNLEGNSPTWVIPFANQKSRKRVKVKRDHVVPLPPQAVAIFRELIAMSGGSEYVIPSPIKQDAPLTSKVLNEVLGDIQDKVDDKRGTLLGVAEHWTPHDLRRTLKTRMSEDLRIPPHITERLLNHSAGGMEATYNLARYEEEIRAALRAWADRLDMLRDGGNVVPMRSIGQ
jgi:integrase